MSTDYNLQFIQQKLQTLRSAVMYTMSDSQRKLPNDIVNFLKADEAGNLWLIAHKPKWSLHTYEQRFPVRFVFYQKGIEFFVETSGTAVLASKEDLVHYEDDLQDGALLLKMTPSFIEYTDTTKKLSFTSLTKLYTSMSSLFSNLFYINSSNTGFPKLGKT